MLRHVLCLSTLLLGIGPAVAAETCFERLAATRDGMLGVPTRAEPTPDGRSVLFLRSGPRDTALRLYRFDLQGNAVTELARPDPGAEHPSVEEKARRERARMTLSGITDYAISRDGRMVLVSEAGRLSRIGLDGSAAPAPVPGDGWIGPRLSPDGQYVAAVRNDELHVVRLVDGQDRQLTTGAGDTLTHGVAEFAAAEELERADGTWWSPDSRTLLYEAADLSGVERHFIADPEHPSVQPVSFRYPRAGTANARLRLGLVSRDGGDTRWVDWDSGMFPYLARVVWPDGKGPLTLVVLNRAQTAERVLAVDPATGHATTLLTETDPAWLDLTPGGGTAGGRALPFWLPDGSGFLWAAERNDRWALELHHADGSLDRTLTTPSVPYLSLADVDAAAGTVTIGSDPDRLGSALYRIPLHGGAPMPIAAEPGLHAAQFSPDGHGMFTDTFDGADGHLRVLVRDKDGHVLATLPSVAEAPAVPRVTYTAVGPMNMDAMVIRPAGFAAGRRYPVVLSVYAGPTVKMVERAPRRAVEDQCLADQGFVVVSLDGRGTPGRGRNWERATKHDLIDLPLQDQADGVKALGSRYPEMDLGRVGVTGWSFGGYFTAMATIRRPDLFKVGVAGAPVVDFADYDTAYTERYLGTPQEDPDGYAKSNVLTYAASLSRPLLLMHGLTDDNVYFENTVKLTQALIAAGKPYQLLLLPGTHLLPDPLIRARVSEARAAFLEKALQGAVPQADAKAPAPHS